MNGGREGGSVAWVKCVSGAVHDSCFGVFFFLGQATLRIFGY